MRPITQPVKNRQNVLKPIIADDFSGGLNVIDNELTLKSKYARVLDNVVRMPDGSNGVRWGTEFLVDMTDFDDVTGDLADNPLTSGPAPGSKIVTVNHTNHGMISGHRVTFTNLVGFDGLLTAELNAEHLIEYIDSNSYSIVVTTGCTVGSQAGGGTSGTFSYDNQNMSGDIVGAFSTDVEGVPFLILVDDTGVVATLRQDTNAAMIIFNDDIAGELSGSPAGWSATSFVAFTQFGSSVIVTNGVDRPLDIDLSATPTASTGFASYLANGSGSNAYVPYAKYVTSLQDFVIMAGGADRQSNASPTKVWISGKGAKGCWPGDTSCSLAPDAIEIDVRNYVRLGETAVRGLHRFRNRLVIVCERAIVIALLGEVDATDESIHLVQLDDAIENIGSLAHHSIHSIGDDLLMVDHTGVPSLTRSSMADLVRPNRRSALIDPLLQRSLTISEKDNVTKIPRAEIANRVWATYNAREGQYMLFIPNHADLDKTTETLVYVFTYLPDLKVEAWTRFRGWNARCGVQDSDGNVILVEGTKIYSYGSETNKVYADRLGDPDIDDPDVGDPIAFVWETPWSNFNDRLGIKTTRFISLDTTGTGRFTVSSFIDRIYASVSTGSLANNPIGTTSGSPILVVTLTDHGMEDGDDVVLEGLTTTNGISEGALNATHRVHSVTANTFSITVEEEATSTGSGGGVDGLYNIVFPSPALTMEFRGGDAWGFGGPLQYYGGERVTRDERLFQWPTKCKLMKVRFEGQTTEELRIIAFGFLYATGGIRI